MMPSLSASQPPGSQQNSSAFRALDHRIRKPLVVAGELPIAVELHDAAHLTIGGRQRPGLRMLQRQFDAEAHAAVVARGVVELDLAHAQSQAAEEEGGRLLVIPNVGAGAEAAAGGIVTTFPAEHETVRRAKYGLRAQCAQVEEGGFLDHVR